MPEDSGGTIVDQLLTALIGSLGIRTRVPVSALEGRGLTTCPTRPAETPGSPALLPPPRRPPPSLTRPTGELQLVGMGRQALGDAKDLIGHVHGLPGIRAQAGQGGSFYEEVSVPDVHVHQEVEVDRANLVGADGQGLGRDLSGVVVYGWRNRPEGSHGGGASGNR